MNNKTYRKILCMPILLLAILFLNEVAWCAGQEKVVFINERKQPDGSYSIYGYYDIYIVNSDGTGLKRLIDNGINPVPSPDGKKIAFISIIHSESDIGISVIKSDGTGRKDLIQKEKEKSIGFCCLRWSPDGKKIAYATSEMGVSDKVGVLSLWVIDVTTGEKKQLYSPLPGIPCLSWSTDSRELLVFTIGFLHGRPDEATIINVKTNKKMKSAIDKLNVKPTNMLILDDKRLLFYKDEALWIMNRDTSNNKKLVHVGKIFEMSSSKPALEILPNKNVRMIIDESGDKGTTIGLYEYNHVTELLKRKAKTDDSGFYGFFSYDGSKILGESETRPTYDENELKKGTILPKPFFYKLYVKDLKSEKEYVLSDSWRVFKQDIVMVYENVNWVAPSE